MNDGVTHLAESDGRNLQYEELLNRFIIPVGASYVTIAARLTLTLPFK